MLITAVTDVVARVVTGSTTTTHKCRRIILTIGHLLITTCRLKLKLDAVVSLSGDTLIAFGFRPECPFHSCTPMDLRDPNALERTNAVGCLPRFTRKMVIGWNGDSVRKLPWSFWWASHVARRTTDDYAARIPMPLYGILVFENASIH